MTGHIFMLATAGTAGTAATDAVESINRDIADFQQLKPGMIKQMLANLGPDLMSLGWKLFIALLIFLIGRKLIRIVQKMMYASFERTGVEVGVSKFLRSLTEFILYALLVFIILGQLGFNTTSILAVLGTASLALSLSLQQSLANFAGGVLILMMKPFKVGDYIICPQGEGTVSMIGLVYTTLATVDNKAITVPNGTLANSTVTNVTAMEKRRLDLTVGIGYQADLKKAKQILEKLYTEHPAIMKDSDITVFVDSLGESSVMIGARGWVAAEDYWKTRWDITEKIKLAFDKAGIEIPFNQMDVHIVRDGGQTACGQSE
ncbi:mechanosensitive ion channel family protein [Clostridium transplantifaecale]|uniref:mechanosensitive ion channel family protein n=1 Tax=Clostridium transplantifaecale TaxID=2479838 RepID=UPI000F63EC51|nr:mechanosensitive ion channel family protein [Clostridium transplantifaecale]